MPAPLIYRTMRKDDEGRPVVASSFGLGVRVAAEVGDGGRFDMATDPEGKVGPDAGGMSVWSGAVSLPPSLIPKDLRAKLPYARGPANAHVYRMGSGPFQSGPVAPGLALRPEGGSRARHGVVEPESIMLLEEYREALASTRPLWSVADAEVK